MNATQLKQMRTVLAPMAGYTDAAFRLLCSQYGCDLTVTEMVSSKALVMGNSNTLRLLKVFDGSAPCFVQIFGHEPQVMADSVQTEQLSRFDGIDVNMGCPVRKIVSNGEGSALLENLPLAGRIVSSLRKATDKPLTVKFRVGVDKPDKGADFARMCRDNGADGITVHLRTRRQMYSGHADYTLLEEILKVSGDMAVFANGDVTDRQSYLAAMKYGVQGVSVGRGALGRPYVFADIKGNDYSWRMRDIYDTVVKQWRLTLQYTPPRVAVNEIKKHIAFYLKGIRGAKSAVVAVAQAKTDKGIFDALDEFFKEYL